MTTLDPLPQAAPAQKRRELDRLVEPAVFAAPPLEVSRSAVETGAVAAAAPAAREARAPGAELSAVPVETMADEPLTL